MQIATGPLHRGVPNPTDPRLLGVPNPTKTPLTARNANKKTPLRAFSSQIAHPTGAGQDSMSPSTASSGASTRLRSAVTDFARRTDTRSTMIATSEPIAPPKVSPQSEK